MSFSIDGPFYATGPKSKGNPRKDSRFHMFHHNQEPVQVFGPLARALGFGPTITKEEWENLIRGFSPDGTQKLISNAGQDTHWGFMVGNAGAAKSASTYFAGAGSAEKAVVLDCHKLASVSAIEFFLRETGVTRRGAGGEKIEAAFSLAVGHTEIANQSNGPHLHYGFCIPNICLRADGSFGTLMNRNMFLMVRAANTIYEVEFATQLKERLNLEIRPLDVGGFNIVGIPERLVEHFSNRRTEMNVELAKHGNSRSPYVQKIAALHTRKDKEILHKEELYARWQKDAAQFGFGPEQARKLSSAKSVTQKTAKKDFQKHYNDLSERTQESQRTSWHLMRAVRKLAIEKGASGEEVSKILKGHEFENRKFIRVEWSPLIRKSPFFSPTKLLKTPRIEIGRQYKRWGDIQKEIQTNVGQVRIQQKMLFPKAKFGPLKELSLPALRFGKMRLRESELWKNGKPGMKIIGGEIRIQNRFLFPRALPWTGASKISIPVPRFVPKTEIKNRKGETKNVVRSK